MKNNTSFHYALMIIVVIIAALLFVSGQQVKRTLFEEFETDIKVNLLEAENLLTVAYQQYTNDIEFLYELPQIEGLAAINPDTNTVSQTHLPESILKAQLTDTFTAFLHKHPQYYQIRILNADGFEYIRVERQGGIVRTVQTIDLQDKSQRYYFTQAKATKENGLFVSYIDLNKEYGQIVFPYQPTVRMAKPLYSEDNTFYGAIVLNIDVSSLLQEAKNLVHSHYDVILLDYERRFIQHSKHSLSFSRDLSPEQTFETVYTMLQQPHGSELKTYKDVQSGSLIYGIGEKITVGQLSDGGTLFPYLMVSDDYFQTELTKRWWSNFSVLAIVLILLITVMFYLNKKNLELNRLLAESEESKAAVDVADEGVVTINKDWHINTVNRSFEHMFSLYNEHVVDQPFKQILDKIGASSIVKQLESDIDTKQSFQGQFKVNIGIQGDYWFNIKVTTIKNSDANARYAVVFSNITNEKLASIALAESNQELEIKVRTRTDELQKARDKALEVSHLKSKFISTISHEMRTPLNGIVGATTLMKKEALSPKLVQLINMADNSVASLSELINDVLDLSKIEAGKLDINYSNFNPESLIEKIAETMSTQCKKKGLEFYVNTNELTFSQIYCDPLRLTQVINNLLSNANKFTESGFISITAWSEVKGEQGFLYIKVSDSGVGISPANQRKLFKAFTQADESISERFGGTGLGLSICKELVSLLKGEISLESALGEGSEFLVKLSLESWQTKPEQDKHLLSEKLVGLMLPPSKLQEHIKNTITAHGGKCDTNMKIAGHDTLDKYDAIFIGVTHPLKEELKVILTQLDNNKSRAPALIEITADHIPYDERITNSKVLILPIFRNELVESVLVQKTVNASEVNIKNTISDVVVPEKTEIPTNQVTQDVSTTVDGKLNLNVLIVDDNEINRQVAMYITEPYCDHVVTVENGIEALAVLEDNTINFDVILMDCNMPGMNGYQTTHNIRLGKAGNFYRSVPIIAMTANALKGENEKCIAAGMNGYITKPVDADLLIKALQDIAASKPATLRIANIDKHITAEEEIVEAPLWDKEGMLERLGGNSMLVNKLLGLFVNDFPDKKAKLKQALHDGNREDIRFFAHTIKGNLGDIGAAKGRQFFEDIEQRALTADMRDLSNVFIDAEKILQQTITLFNEVLADG